MTTDPVGRVCPTPLHRGEVEEVPTCLLPSETVDQYGRETAFIRRVCMLNPVVFLLVLAHRFGVKLQRHLATLKKGYDPIAAVPSPTYPEFYPRFTPVLSKFLERCLEHAMGELAHEPGRILDPRLARIEDLLINESIAVRLHATLASKCPSSDRPWSLQGSWSTCR